MAVSRPHGRSGRAAGRARSSAICNLRGRSGCGGLEPQPGRSHAFVPPSARAERGGWSRLMVLEPVFPTSPASAGQRRGGRRAGLRPLLPAPLSASLCREGAGEGASLARAACSHLASCVALRAASRAASHAAARCEHRPSRARRCSWGASAVSCARRRSRRAPAAYCARRRSARASVVSAARCCSPLPSSSEGGGRGSNRCLRSGWGARVGA